MERVFVNTVLIVLCLDPLKSPPLNFGIFVIPSKFIPCTNLYYYYLVSVISCKFLPCTSLYYYYFVSVISFKFLPCTNLNYYYLVSVISCKFLLCTSLYYYYLISVISYKFLPCTNLYYYYLVSVISCKFLPCTCTITTLYLWLPVNFYLNSNTVFIGWKIKLFQLFSSLNVGEVQKWKCTLCTFAECIKSMLFLFIVW